MNALLQAGQIAGTIVVTAIVLGALVLVHEVGHFVAARLVGIRVLEFGIGFPPRAKVLTRRGDTAYTLNYIPIGGFVKMEGEDLTSEDPKAFSNAGLPKQLFVLAAGVTMNLITAFVLFFFAMWLFNPAIGFKIADVVPQSPAYHVGLQPDQTIDSINGQRFGALSAQDASQTLRSHAGQTVVLGVIDADGSHHVVAVTLADQQAIAENKGALGVKLAPIALGGTLTSDPVSAVPASASATANAFGAILGALRDLGAGILNNPTQAPSQVGGPVAIGEQVGIVIWNLGPIWLVLLAAQLSASLALMNFLPFPPLDGGRIVVVVVKRLFGSRGVSWVEATTYLVGFALLISFIVWITYFDIGRLAQR